MTNYFKSSAAVAFLATVTCSTAFAQAPQPAQAPAAAPAATAPAATVFDFTADKAGGQPTGFSFGTGGRGRPGAWSVRADEPARGNVLAQTDGDNPSGRFPVAVVDSIIAADVDVSVSYKPISGKDDQAAGLVWRYKDINNYYIVRANALEDNVVLYKVEGGKRIDLPLVGKGQTYGAKAPVPKAKWGTLRVTAQGKLFTVYSNGAKLFEVEDLTFKDAGKVGVWTKADSVMYFDDLSITVIK